MIKGEMMNFFIDRARSFFLIKCLGLLFIPCLLWSGKTDSVDLLSLKELKQAHMTNLYLNEEHKLQLVPQPKKILQLDSSVIWNSYRDQDYLVLVTGNEGDAFIYDQNFKLVHQVKFDSPEITAVTRDDQGNFYFGSGPDGIIYRLSSDFSQKEEFLLTKKQFIWDLLYRDGFLYYATGGDGGVYRIDPQKKGQAIKTSERLFVAEEPNILRLKLKQDKLYFSSDHKGKLYQLDLSDTNQVKIVFDGGDKDVVDFVFQGQDIYLATAGTGPLSTLEKKVSGIPSSPEIKSAKKSDQVAKSFNQLGFKNYLIKIDAWGKMKILYQLKRKNVSRLANFFNPATQENNLLVGLVEEMKIYRLTTVPFPKLELTHFNRGDQLSSFFQFKDRYYLTSANQGSVYELTTRYQDQGELISKVIDFKQTVRWGRVTYNHYKPNHQAEVWIRIGETRKPGIGWSEWIEEKKLGHLSLNSRFIQIKLILKKESNTSPHLGDLKLYYAYRNLPHRVITLKFFSGFNPGGVAPPNEEGVSLTGTFEGTDSDQFELIKNSAESDQNQPNNLFPILNYQIDHIFSLHWNVFNPDKDRLKYLVEYTKVTGEHQAAEKEWKVLKKNYLKNSLFFDKRKFVDGVYQFRITADDSLDHGSEHFKDRLTSTLKIIDNHSPKVAFKSIEKKNSQETIMVTVTDEMSKIKSASYSLDRKTLYQLNPLDGVFDEKSENFRIVIPSLPADSDEWVFFTQDDSGNLIYQTIEP